MKDIRGFLEISKYLSFNGKPEEYYTVLPSIYLDPVSFEDFLTRNYYTVYVYLKISDTRLDMTILDRKDDVELFKTNLPGFWKCLKLI